MRESNAANIANNVLNLIEWREKKSIDISIKLFNKKKMVLLLLLNDFA